MPGERARRLSGADAIEYPAPLAETVDKSRLAEEFEMSRHARLALPEDLRELADGQLAPRAQHQQPQPRRLRDGAQGGKQRLHRDAEIG